MRNPSVSDEDSRSEYALLDDVEGDKTAVDDDDDDLVDQSTARLPQFNNDPLADIFGSDTSTWSEIRQEGPRHRDQETIIPSGSELEDEPSVRDEEVFELWEKNKRPKLPLPSSVRKGAPPPLKLIPSVVKNSSKEPQSALDSAFDERKMKRRTGMIFGEFELKIGEPEQVLLLFLVSVLALISVFR
jgi:hypothetical protein